MGEVIDLRQRVTIGGSSAAAACGIDPHRSRIMLWAELTGKIRLPETEAMRWGTILQPVIVHELNQRGYPVRGSTMEVTDEERPWLVGHPDAYLIDDEWEAGVVEVKTASAWAKWTDGVPLAYEAQVQTYLHLTGLEHGLLACLVGGQRLEVREVERSQAVIEMMLALMDEFVGYVERDEPPPPDGSSSARDALAQLYPEHAPEKVVRLNRTQLEVVAMLQQRRSQLAVVKEQADALENQVRGWMGDAETAIDLHDEPVAHWRSYTEHRIDSARLKADEPELAARYMNANRRRRFTLA